MGMNSKVLGSGHGINKNSGGIEEIRIGKYPSQNNRFVTSMVLYALHFELN
jgi:hypothetical protein